MIPTFAQRRKQWSSPPVDDVGYLASKDLLTWHDEALLELVVDMEHARYSGWRNWNGNWRRVLGLDKTEDKDVLDYGCGVGVEALQYAKTGNRVSAADISTDNIALTERVLDLYGHPATSSYLILSKPPFIVSPGLFDVIHCSGVLHHIPEPLPVVEHMHSWLRTRGELRLMLYSDEAWRIATKTEPPDGNVFDYVEFDQFWQHWDAVGGYADWYDREKLENRFGKWFEVKHCEPLTKEGAYIGAVLVKR